MIIGITRQQLLITLSGRVQCLEMHGHKSELGVRKYPTVHCAHIIIVQG